jgi:predicted phage terminase large subunit-like protein
MGRRSDGRIVIADAINIRKNASVVREVMKSIASQDKSRFNRVTIVIPQDPGQAGKDQVGSLTKHLAGYRIKSVRETGAKATRAEPFSAQWQAGNVEIVEGKWNKDFLLEMSAFPGAEHDDYVDASSGAFLECIDNQYDKWVALAS